MAKQILTIVDDCRNCHHFVFNSCYEGGTEFTCEISENLESRLIPWDNSPEDGFFIHEDCPLEDKK